LQTSDDDRQNTGPDGTSSRSGTEFQVKGQGSSGQREILAELENEADARALARLRSRSHAGAVIIVQIHKDGTHAEIAAYVGGRTLKL
jgi:hypothetical protein